VSVAPGVGVEHPAFAWNPLFHPPREAAIWPDFLDSLGRNEKR